MFGDQKKRKKIFKKNEKFLFFLNSSRNRVKKFLVQKKFKACLLIPVVAACCVLLWKKHVGEVKKTRLGRDFLGPERPVKKISAQTCFFNLTNMLFSEEFAAAPYLSGNDEPLQNDEPLASQG